MHSFKNRGDVTLLEGMGNAFPPTITLVIRERYYMNWMARRVNGTRNELRGYVSSERSALEMINHLMDYYENLAGTDGIRSYTGGELIDKQEQFINSLSLRDIKNKYDAVSTPVRS
jgi:hypothetical protein